MKVLLIDVALGMTPAKEWNGRYDANGGYIVIRKDGEIVCYHFTIEMILKITYITIPVLTGQAEEDTISEACFVAKTVKYT